jgi:uracil-DNA glycosylase
VTSAATAADYVPKTRSLRTLATAAAVCQRCELFEAATQTVFGAGPRSARIMFVGEQPGDVEDQRGEPFVGPAGKLLDDALRDAGIDRDEIYLTNAVKHFRWKPAERGKRRIHDKPAARHVNACRPWLAAELSVVRPDVVVALGAVAASTLFGLSFTLTRHRGEALLWPPSDGPFAEHDGVAQVAFATIHPSAVLRAGPKRRETYAEFVRDLEAVRDA